MPIFTGRVEKGKLVLDDPSRFFVRISALNGQKIELVIMKRKYRRSLPQNAAYWGIMVEILSHHTGYDKDSMHDALKAKFASKIDPATGLLIIERTSKMDTKRFNEYYESIQRWAAEFLGCYIPSPNECEYL